MKLPDGPQAPPWLQIVQTIVRPFEFLEECAQRYGDTFTLRSPGGRPYVVLSHPQALQELFTADPKLFDVGNKSLQFFLGDNSLLLLDGERHQRQRRLLLPPFHGERMRAYGNLMCDITQQVMTQWPIDKPFSGYAAMQEVSLHIILRAVFGLDEGPRFQQLRQLFVSMSKAFDALNGSLLFLPFLQVDLGSWSPWGRFLRQKQQVDQLLYSEIRERRAQPDSSSEDILSLMMSARDDTGQPMTDVELRDELMTLLFAGHDTTTSALAWALYWIHHLPSVREKLLQELSHLDWEPNQPEWGLQIARLPYLNAVCQETLRIYPIAQFAFARIVKTPFQLMGYQFDPGTVLAPCIHLLHRRAELYPEPRCFKPERFLERQFSAYEYLPFGGSNRRCIGMAFAQLEMKLVLATILSRFQLALAESRPVRPVGHGVIFKPSGGLQMVVTGQQSLSPTLVQL